ncbi:MAG: STAS-like domain-containing protein [Treponema sp.]
MAILDVLKDCGENYKYQGPRFIALGPDSGEEFRENYLIPWLKNNKDAAELIVNFEGTVVYTPSFLEESFGGAIRKSYEEVRKIKFINIPSNEEVKLKTYIAKAQKGKK